MPGTGGQQGVQGLKGRSVAARLLALDWGTTSLRASLLGEGGVVLEQRQQPWGIQQLPEGGYVAALRGIAGDWLQALAGLPIIASGMVGSAQGWREVPYLPCPADAAALAAGLLGFEAWPGKLLHIVPGVRVATGTPDVMRGEETQVLGVLALQPALAQGRATLLLPGTHSKWVQLDAGRITALRTYMTGELYGLLAQHSILGRPAREAGGATPSGDAFERGIAAVRATGSPGLASLLFSTRTLVLAGQLSAAHSLDYLSGLLLGDELRSALAAPARLQPLLLVGEASLCARYQRALALFDVASQVAADGAAAAGLWHIARQAGLLHPS
jgi:2-dehydro-3-deoxygalactonokinase